MTLRVGGGTIGTGSVPAAGEDNFTEQIKGLKADFHEAAAIKNGE